MHASVRALLTGERTALNLLQRMSGIATDHAALRRPGGRDRRAAAGHAQDRARPARAGQARRGLRRRHQPSRRPARRRADQGQPRGGRRRRAGRGRARPPAPSRTTGRGRGRHDGRAAAGARRRRRRDPARQHAARRSCAGRWQRRPDAHAWRRPAASPSTPSARWPRPGSTRSRWERSRTRCARSTSHWRYHHQHPDRTRYRDHAGRGARAGTRAQRRDPGPQLPGAPRCRTWPTTSATRWACRSRRPPPTPT